MPNFNMKEWLDTNIVPLTAKTPISHVYSWIWNGNPPKEILVWIMPGSPSSPDSDKPFDPAAWPELVKRLLVEDLFRFDYLREQQMVQVDENIFPVFGGDGAPLFGKEGMASARLFKKIEDISLILQIGCQYSATTELQPGKAAAAAVKYFFNLFGEENPLSICSKYGAPFGQA